jgi:RNA polymerase sigma factor (sigma-70 family)
MIMDFSIVGNQKIRLKAPKVTVHDEREELLEGAIQQLPPRLRQVVQMKIIDGRSGEEVSQTLGISVAAAKSRLARAKIALRISLASGD